jgi:hypothetical protein
MGEQQGHAGEGLLHITETPAGSQHKPVLVTYRNTGRQAVQLLIVPVV